MEFLSDGSPDCPLLRLYDFDASHACELQLLLLALADGTKSNVPLQETLAADAVGGCILVLQTVDTDQGIVWDGSVGMFFCRLHRSSWREVAGRAAPFCISSKVGQYQWLDETSSISWLLSPDGSW